MTDHLNKFVAFNSHHCRVSFGSYSHEYGYVILHKSNLIIMLHILRIVGCKINWRLHADGFYFIRKSSELFGYFVYVFGFELVIGGHEQTGFYIKHKDNATEAIVLHGICILFWIHVQQMSSTRPPHSLCSAVYVTFCKTNKNVVLTWSLLSPWREKYIYFISISYRYYRLMYGATVTASDYAVSRQRLVKVFLIFHSLPNQFCSLNRSFIG